MNNKLNWKTALSHLRNYMGANTFEVDNRLSDTAFRKKLVKTIEDASNQYRSLTGARYKGPDFDRIYQEDKMRLQHTEELIEKMLIVRPLTYELSVFEKWNSDNKGAILLRAQSARTTPLCTNNQNVFHMFGGQSGEYWLREWHKNRICMPDHVTAQWLNDLSDQNQTPLQMFLAELCGELKLHTQYTNRSVLRCEYLDAITDATIIVLHNDWGVLNDQSPQSIVQYWNAIKKDNDIQRLYPNLFERIQAVITKKISQIY